jgi:WD40 repeat protein
LIDGNYYPICDSSVDLHVTACLFYCRANWFQSGACVRQNNIPICKCGIASTTTASTSYITTTPNPTTILTTTVPFGSLLLTLNGHSWVEALTVLQNGDLVSSGDFVSSIKIWNPIDGTLKRTLYGHTSYVRALTILQNGDLASGSDDNTI